MIGGDGGVGISYDRSATYVWLNNMPLGQFYHVTYDMKTPYTVCGGLQDNNTWCGPSAVRSRDGIANDDWFIIGGGDGFVAQADPGDARILYAESQNGRMNRIDRVTNERQPIRPEAAEGEPKLRWNWDTPMLLSPHDPATVFVAANKVFRSRDRGFAWEAVSPGPHHQRGPRRARDHGGARKGHRDREKRRPRRVPDARHLRRVGAKAGAVLGGLGRRVGACLERCRPALDGCHQERSRASQGDLRLPARPVAIRRRSRCTPPSTDTGWEISARTSTRATTSERAGGRSRRICRREKWRAPSPRTSAIPTSSIWEPNEGSTSPSIEAGSGIG